MRRTTYRRLTLILGILALLISVCSQFFEIQTTAKYSKKAVTEETQNENEEAYFSIPTSSLPSAHVELNRDVFFLFETLLSEENVNEISAFPDTLLISLFDTLIGSFISPNAP
jgi:hypothetical protein